MNQPFGGLSEHKTLQWHSLSFLVLFGHTREVAPEKNSGEARTGDLIRSTFNRFSSANPAIMKRDIDQIISYDLSIHPAYQTSLPSMKKGSDKIMTVHLPIKSKCCLISKCEVQ